MTLHVAAVQISASRRCAAAILGDGTVECWGLGLDGRRICPAQLRNVTEIEASTSAFAAILNAGSVATWGNEFAAQCGPSYGKSRRFKRRSLLRGVLKDGSVVTWGSPLGGVTGAKSDVYTVLDSLQRC